MVNIFFKFFDFKCDVEEGKRGNVIEYNCDNICSSIIVLWYYDYYILIVVIASILINKKVFFKMEDGFIYLFGIDYSWLGEFMFYKDEWERR